MILYALRDIVQRYNGRTVLDIDHLTIETGRIHALLGANGAGKSTLLRVLAFLEEPARGTVFFSGAPVEYSPTRQLALRRRVVLIDQHPIMFSTTVAKNIEFGLTIRKIDQETRRRTIDQALAMVGLSRYRQTRAHELSGGETQRLALARGLALAPEVLLCDEPTASVDAENQVIIADLLRRINAELGTTIVFTSHDRIQAATLAHHTLVLAGGRLIDTGADNVFACMALPQPDGSLLYRLAGNLDIRVNDGQRPPPGPATSGHIAIDPWQIDLQWPASACGDGPGKPLAGTVTAILAEGGHIRVEINIGVLLVVRLRGDVYRLLLPAVGESMLVRPAAAGCSFHPS